MTVPTSTSTRRVARGSSLLALLASAAVVAFGAMAAPAHAGSNESIKVGGGKVSFIAHGEGLAVWDTRKDGDCMNAVLAYDVFTGDPLKPVEHFTATARACGAGDRDLIRLSIPERTEVKLTACYSRSRGGKQYMGQCSGSQYATA